MQSIQAFYPQLTSPKKVIITTHQKPDGDAMGSSLGLYHFLTSLGHSVTVISPTNWAGFLKWMPGAANVIDFEASKEVAIALIKEAELLFCLDFNVLHRTKNMEPVLAELDYTKVLIDHHQQPQEDYFTYGVSNTEKSSTCEMIFDFIIESGFAKTTNHNFNLLKNLSIFKMLEKPILAGISRKATIYKTLGTTPEEALNGTTVLNTIALQNGANILRVHDVKEAVEAVKLVEALALS